MEIRGIKVKKEPNKSKGFYMLRPANFYAVPLLYSSGQQSIRCVNVGDAVKEGTAIAKPNGKYGYFVYSPCSGKVVSIIKKLNVYGNECEHVVIGRDLSGQTHTFPVLGEEDVQPDVLLKRLYESGIVDNFEPFDVGYKKYLLKCPIKTLLVNCIEDDPFDYSTTALLETYESQIMEGARLFQKICNAEKIVFAFSFNQRKIAKQLKSYIRKLGLSKTLKIKFFPNIYPLHYSRLLGYYQTRKMVREGGRTAETGVIVESVCNCYDFYNAVRLGVPLTQRAITISGKNCLRKANYFVKNGTSINHIMEVVGEQKSSFDYMLVYGGVMSGIAQETSDISATLTSSTLLFCDTDEFSVENETACINCGKCLEVCPVRLNVKELDDLFFEGRYSKAKNMGVETCLECGCCSFVCPAKRFLTQRITFMKDLALGRVGKKAESSGYVVVEGEDPNQQEEEPDEILDLKDNFSTDHQNFDRSEVDQMIKELEDERKPNKDNKYAYKRPETNGEGGEKNEQ